jgi:hypothetical protein
VRFRRQLSVNQAFLMLTRSESPSETKRLKFLRVRKPRETTPVRSESDPAAGIEQ